MRRAALAALALLATAPLGCDLVGGGPDYAFMDRLEGTWTLARYEERRILDDGAHEVVRDLRDAGTFVFAPQVDCPETGFDLEGGELFGRAYTFEGDSDVTVPNEIGGCGIVFADDPALRINFIGGAGLGGDVMLTIDRDASGEQVWSRYRLFESDGYVLHTRYTLTR